MAFDLTGKSSFVERLEDLCNRFTLAIEFRTKSDAIKFLNWMDGQGEQDLCPWYEERGDTPPRFYYNRNEFIVRQL